MYYAFYPGLPIITSVMRTKEGDTISLTVHVITFPQPPFRTITLMNENEDTVELIVPRFVPVPLQYTAYGQSVDVSGYETNVTITNNSVEWLGDINVFITNRYGTRVYTVTTTSDDRENKNPLGKALE
jgi:hypothetical protein